MRERYEIDTRLVDEYLSWYGTDHDLTLPEAVEWLQGLLEQVPAEHRAQSYFKIESESDYDGGYTTTLRIGYTRDETDEEFRQREAKKRAEEAAYAARYEAQERGTLEALKRKYG